jgi:5'-3' exonuclease
MGIPYYVASLLKSHKHIQTQCGNAPLKVDVLGIDFNCFIHTYLKAENPIGSIVVALHELLTMTVHANKVYIAFDGLVPYAKIVQQRYRRMRKGTVEGFDKHQISPGTPFMKSLADTLRFMYPEYVISDTMEPGEGEHKIFTWLRTMPDTDRRNICIYGLDADLVLISLAQNHLGKIELLRELPNGGFSTLSVNALASVLPIHKDIFVQMSIMNFGNDFMPNLAMFSLREDGYARGLQYASRNDAHTAEMKTLLKRAKEDDRRILAVDGRALESRFGCQLMDGVIDWEPVCYAFWKTYEWTYHYFTTSEVLDWEWYYPYAEAPLLSTIESFERPTTFEWKHPTPILTVEDQLRFILPAHSLRKAGLEPIYPDELYDEETETRHPWMKRFAWECDPWVSLPRGELTSVARFVPQQS